MTEKKKGLPFPELAARLMLAMNTGEAGALNFPIAWPHIFRVLEPTPGARIVVEEFDDLVIAEVPIEHVTNCIMRWALDQKLPEFYLTLRRAREVADMWRGATTPIPASAIRLVRWADEPGYTWHRMCWRKEYGPTPTWDRLLSRMTNNQAFIAWVGSLFFEQSDLQQYCYLYGVGGDGKGSINRFLEAVFGKAYRSKQPMGGNGQSDKFWTYGLIGARLVAFPDCDDPTFVSRGLFKSLTGGDAMAVEAKGGMAFTVRLNAKYLVISNEKPTISSEKADMRRIIYCELGSAPAVEPGFEDRLWEEGGAFLTSCVDTYLALYPAMGAIKSDNAEVEDWVGTLEESMEEVFAKWFALDATSFVLPSDMQRILRLEWPKQRRQHLDFYKWLERTHKIRKKTHRVDDETTQHRYAGLLMKQTPLAEVRMYPGGVHQGGWQD